MRLRLLGDFAAWERAVAVDVLRGRRQPLVPRRTRLIEAAYRDPAATADLVRTAIGVVVILRAHGETTPIAIAGRWVTAADLGLELCA